MITSHSCVDCVAYVLTYVIGGIVLGMDDNFADSPSKMDD
jgi:hypothetical protein